MSPVDPLSSEQPVPILVGQPGASLNERSTFRSVFRHSNPGPVAARQLNQVARLARRLCLDTFGSHSGIFLGARAGRCVGVAVFSWGGGNAASAYCPQSCRAIRDQRIIVCEGRSPSADACTREGDGGLRLCIPVLAPMPGGQAEPAGLIFLTGLGQAVPEALCLGYWVQGLIETSLSRFVQGVVQAAD